MGRKLKKKMKKSTNKKKLAPQPMNLTLAETPFKQNLENELLHAESMPSSSPKLGLG